MSRFQNSMRLNLIVMLFAIHGCWLSIAIRDSCPVSPLTVKIVGGCPDNEGEWRLAAERKNCSAYASQCDKPEKLMYHCVINAFVNETLEVCAYRRNIVFGYCAEYSYGANRIQENYKTVCSSFLQNPCPTGYNSTQAYRYPGCYELTKTTKKSTTETTLPAEDIKRQQQANTVLIIVAIFIMATVIGLIMIIMCRFKPWKSARFCVHHQRKESHEKNTICEEEEMKNLCNIDEIMTNTKSHNEDTMHKEGKEELVNLCKVEEEMTDRIKRHIAPSGQSFGEEESKKVTIVPDENNPDHLLKPEEDSEQDCQTLLSVLDDGIEKLMLMHSKDGDEDNLPNLHHDYGEPELPFSEDAIELIKEDIATVENFISEYFKKSKNKRSKIRKENDSLTSSTY